MAVATRKRKTEIRQAEVIDLARGGQTNVAIAGQLGCSEALVRYHVKQWVAAKEPPAERAQELREQWYDRLEHAHQKNWPLVEAGDPKAIEVMLKIQAQASRLFGLDLQPGIQVAVLTRESLAAFLWDASASVEAIEGTATEITDGG